MHNGASITHTHSKPAQATRIKGGDCYRQEISGICRASAKRAAASHMGQRLRHRTVALLRASCIAPAVQGLQPGQFYASQVQIATQLHWARKTVGTALQRLAGKALLEVNTSDKGTIITVMYWEEISSGRGFQEEPPRENPVLFPLPAEEEVGGRIKWISR